MSAAEPTILVEDIYAAGACVLGARRWFAQHGLDFKAWINGEPLPVSSVRRTGCAIGERVCRAAEQRFGQENSERG